MIEGWALWLLLAGLAVGAGAVGVLMVRLPRKEEDVSSYERRSESAWIAGTIERNGGVAPASLVEEVLDLHQAYLQATRLPPGIRLPVTPPADGSPPGAPPGATPWPTVPGARAAPGAPHPMAPAHPPPPPGYGDPATSDQPPQSLTQPPQSLTQPPPTQPPTQPPPTQPPPPQPPTSR